jgi:hypothetical protein
MSEIAPAAESCGLCVFYFRRDTDQAAAERALARLGHVTPEGHCRRYPEWSIQTTSHWCGEFRPRREGK